MIDDDDAFIVAALWPEGGCLWTILGVVICVTILILVNISSNDCAKKTCDSGRPMIVNHECVCVGEPK